MSRLYIEAEILDDRLGKTRIAKGYVFQFDIAAQFCKTLFFDLGLVAIVLTVLHDVLDALHLRAHFLYGLTCGYESCRRGAEGRKHSLKRHDHTDGKSALHRKPYAECQDNNSRYC